MELIVGPNQYFWEAHRWARFYDDLAQVPIARVLLGELVCSKRLPFYQYCIPEAISILFNAGKQGVLTSIALVTLNRECKLTAELVEMGIEVEINDLTALSHLPEGTRFTALTKTSDCLMVFILVNAASIGLARQRIFKAKQRRGGNENCVRQFDGTRRN